AVVGVTEVVPPAGVGLSAAGSVRRPRLKGVPARSGVPGGAPTLPGVRGLGSAKLDRLPGGPAVEAQLDPLNRLVARPGQTPNFDRAGPERGAIDRVGDHRADAALGEGSGRAVLVGEDVPLDLEVAIERLIEGVNLGKPLDRRDPVPAGDQQADRESVLAG